MGLLCRHRRRRRKPSVGAPPFSWRWEATGLGRFRVSEAAPPNACDLPRASSQKKGSQPRSFRSGGRLRARNFVYRRYESAHPALLWARDSVASRANTDRGQLAWLVRMQALYLAERMQRPASPTSASLGLRQTPTFAVQPRSIHSVLVLDDERGVRDSLRLILEPQFRVLTASRGEAALRILDR
jgi:hypothetical protein